MRKIKNVGSIKGSGPRDYANSLGLWRKFCWCCCCIRLNQIHCLVELQAWHLKLVNRCCWIIYFLFTVFFFFLNYIESLGHKLLFLTIISESFYICTLGLPADTYLQCQLNLFPKAEFEWLTRHTSWSKECCFVGWKWRANLRLEAFLTHRHIFKGTYRDNIQVLSFQT